MRYKTFEFTGFLVDGAHWQGNKKLKHPSKTDKKGHISCSEGYNFNNYKKSAWFYINSQNREIMHSTIDKCVNSLKLKTYHDFFYWMIAFFAIQNLTKMNLI